MGIRQFRTAGPDYYSGFPIAGFFLAVAAGGVLLLATLSVAGLCSLAALQAVFVLFAVFPFDFGVAWNEIARLALLALIVAIAIGTIVTAVLAVLHPLRATARVVSKVSYTGRQ